RGDPVAKLVREQRLHRGSLSRHFRSTLRNSDMIRGELRQGTPSRQGPQRHGCAREPSTRWRIRHTTSGVESVSTPPSGCVQSHPDPGRMGLDTTIKGVEPIKLAPRTLIALAAALLALHGPAHAALAPLPADGSQVNADPANSIDPGQDAGVSDVTGGAVTAGELEVPWAAFEPQGGSAHASLVSPVS